MSNYILQQFPKTRLASFDVYAIGKKKHHVSALIECDVTDSRIKIRQLKRKGHHISFTGWLIKTISNTIIQHNETAAYLYNKRKIIIFNDVNISTLVEKKIDKQKVPIALLIEKANQKSISEITREIQDAQNKIITSDDIVLHNKPGFIEKLYFVFPGFIRRSIWKLMLKFPKLAYKKMGNVVVTSVGSVGQINGWFVHNSVHPLSFGIGSVIKKPVVIQNEIQIREILNMTILIDHDVVDGAPMSRFVGDLIKSIEKGFELY